MKRKKLLGSPQCEVKMLTPNFVFLEYNFHTPSQNVLYPMFKNGKVPAWVIKHKWKKTFMKCMRNFELMKRKNCRKKITVTRIYTGRKRELDYDNFVGGCKPMIDALKTVGFIIDDKPSWLDREYTQVKGDRNSTLVRVYDL